MKPFVTCVKDYNEFRIISRAFLHAGFDVKHTEIGCGQSELTGNTSYDMYHAVFYLRSHENTEHVKNLILDWKSKIKRY